MCSRPETSLPVVENCSFFLKDEFSFRISEESSIGFCAYSSWWFALIPSPNPCLS